MTRENAPNRLSCNPNKPTASQNPRNGLRCERTAQWRRSLAACTSSWHLSLVTMHSKFSCRKRLRDPTRIFYIFLLLLLFIFSLYRRINVNRFMTYECHLKSLRWGIQFFFFHFIISLKCKDYLPLVRIPLYIDCKMSVSISGRRPVLRLSGRSSCWKFLEPEKKEKKKVRKKKGCHAICWGIEVVVINMIF